jgi:hypothetical protein
MSMRRGAGKVKISPEGALYPAELISFPVGFSGPQAEL